ncbi:unnamed protein product [Camellia sinensis]
MGNHNGCFSRRHHKNRHGSNSSPPPGKSEVPPYKSGTSDHGFPPQITDSSSSMSSLSLPYARVDSSLRALAGQAEGFGRLAIGGLQGPLYHVTTLADDGPGSLREGCRKKEPLWIVFEVSGTIGLSSYLNVSSYKTIDGRGQRMKLTGKGLRLKECEHVIICNLEFEGGRGPDVDGIQIKPKSKHIWIDRCSLSDYDDGLIDITRESTDITISRCHFSKHDKTMLIGADPSHTGDRCIRVTIHHCFFDGTRQRHPRVSVESQIYSQCNIYEAGQKKVAFKYLTEKVICFYLGILKLHMKTLVTSRNCFINGTSFFMLLQETVRMHALDGKISSHDRELLTLEATDKEEASTGCIKSEGDGFLYGTQGSLLTTATADNIFRPSEYYPTWTVEAPTDALKKVLQQCTGWQSVPRPADYTK